MRLSCGEINGERVALGNPPGDSCGPLFYQLDLIHDGLPHLADVGIKEFAIIVRINERPGFQKFYAHIHTARDEVTQAVRPSRLHESLIASENCQRDYRRPELERQAQEFAAERADGPIYADITFWRGKEQVPFADPFLNLS